MDLISITIIDLGNSSESRTRTFSTHSVKGLIEGIREFQEEVPFRRYQLLTNDDINDYNMEIREVLDQEEVEY